ncbi:MAG: peptide ABC transporter [Rhodobacteraceae bacterium]|nr:peptide ABC transporter [Paracoccaceae bacterium]MBR26828.1 peptide ABC transporter [Paracoccaceae bacterium]
MVSVTFLTFLLVNVLPGDVAYEMTGMDSSEEEVQAIRDELGLDRNVVLRYAEWAGGILTGDWGASFINKEEVWHALAQRFPVSLELMLLAQLIALSLAVPMGLISAYRPGGRADRVIGTLAFASVSMPSFMTAILLIFFFSLHLGWLPATGYEPLSAGLWENLRPMILPALALGLVEWTVLMRTLRAEMIGVLQENYIALARAKGMSDARILLVHALRPSSFSMITLLGLQVGRLMGGSIIIEQIFGIPGIGRLLVHAVNTRDFIMIQGCVTLFAIAFVTANFLVDIAYAWLDPRVRLERARG